MGLLAVALIMGLGHAYPLAPPPAAAAPGITLAGPATTPGPEQSTTGPTPPPAAGLAHGGAVQGAAAGETVISGVPAYLWRHGCGPTAVGMVVGYYDSQGYDLLIPGDAATQTGAVDQALASQGGAGSPGHYEDYVLPMDDTGYSSPRPDKSELPAGDEHPSDSVADFMHTSWSVDDNFYGWSWSNMVGPAFTDYVSLRSGTFTATSTTYYVDDGSLSWARVKGEVDASRPMVFLVDSSGDGYTDHFVTVIGYRETSGYPEYACWDTWSTTNIRWQRFRAMSSVYSWGAWGGFTFGISGPVTPTSYTVAATVPGGHGTADPGTQEVVDGDPATVQFSADPGYWLGRIYVDGVAQTVTNPFVLTSVTQDHAVTAYFAPDSALSLPLLAGWNLLAGGPGSDVLGRPLFRFDNSAYSSSTAEGMQAGRGYWCRLSSPGTALLVTMPSPISCNLEVGWNMVGNSSSAAVALPAGMVAFTYDGSGYNSATVLQPGQGAWLRSDAAQTIQLEAAG